METANSSALCIGFWDILETCKFDEKVAHGVCLIYDVEIIYVIFQTKWLIYIIVRNRMKPEMVEGSLVFEFDIERAKKSRKIGISWL